MNKNKQKLDDLLFIKHKGDITSDSKTNIHLYTFKFIFDLLRNPSEAKKCKYLKCKGFKDLCDDIRKNLPKNIFIKDEYGDYKVDEKNPKNTLFDVYNHSIEYALKSLGF